MVDYIISIVLFVIALGILISIHELGHLIAAKTFKVYCLEYSIGMGPKIFRRKRKNGETYFALRAIPFGGYVSMVGEETDEKDLDIKVPKERSLVGISRWKKVIIFIAGVAMNFMLAYLIFLMSFLCFPTLNEDNFAINIATISDSALFSEMFDGESSLSDDTLKLIDGNTITYTYHYFNENDEEKEKSVRVNVLSSTPITYDDVTYILVLDTSSFSGYNDLDYSIFFKYYECIEVSPTSIPSNITDLTIYGIDADNEDKLYYLPILNEYGNVNEMPLKSSEEIKGNLVICNYQSEDEFKEVTFKYAKDSEGNIEKLGLSINAEFEYKGWSSFQKAGEQRVESTTLVAQGLGGLFSGSEESWSSIGGPVAILSQTTTILKNYPFYVYLQTWGTISVNLGLLNLIPFPGLDGWQILVEIIEGIVNLIMKPFKNKKKKKELTLKEKEEDANDNTSIVNSQNTIVVGEKVEEVKEEDWKIPPKVKNIVSMIGIILLFGFMMVILFKDIFSLF